MPPEPVCVTSLRLVVELVPATTWYTNVRSHISKAQWDALKRQTARHAGYRCEICGGKGSRWPVECHEIWEYDDANSIQTLVGLTALCPACHEVKHFGFAASQGHGERALGTLMRVNHITREQARTHVEQALARWQARSSRTWTVDLTWLKEVMT